MNHGWIMTPASPEVPGAQVSLMSEDLTAPVVPDLGVEVDGLGELAAVYAAVRDSGAEIVHPLRDEEWEVCRSFARALPAYRHRGTAARCTRTGSPGAVRWGRA
jgi:hypothetical protein